MTKVKIYTTNYCPHCVRAKNLLKRKKVSFEEIDLTDNAALRGRLEEETGWMTVPMIFIGKEFIGGADNLEKLEEAGELDAKLRP